MPGQIYIAGYLRLRRSRRLGPMRTELTEWLYTKGYGAPIRSEPVGGGCINEASRLYFADGATLFLKSNRAAPIDMFRTEAQGLLALANSVSLRVPDVIYASDDFLLLEDLGNARARSDYWEGLGAGLASLHAKPQSRFGFECDNYCGSTLQVNTPVEDGLEFFAEFRIRRLAQKAQQQSLLDTNELTALLAIADNLQKWIPAMPAVLIHGDLWSGNVHCDGLGTPALIDPACYWGWAEAELAMTILFGGFAEGFYAAYAEHAAVAPDWRDRAPLYNLYHLLNHLLLFGESYRAQIQQVSKRFLPR